MTQYLIWIAVAFQMASLLILTRSPWGAIPFVAAACFQALIIWLERGKVDDLAALKRQISALESTISTLSIRVNQW